MTTSTPNQEERKAVVPPKYSDEERKHLGMLTKNLCNDRDLRNQAHEELDGMTYLQYWESNRKKDLSYVPPKKNKHDIRIVTGTTREKDSDLLSVLLNLELKPDIAAFDEEDLFVSEFGDNMSDAVVKSREIEDYAKVRPIIYREMISQGDVFVQEMWIEEFKKVPTSKLNWNPRGGKMSDFDFTERVKKVFEGAKVRRIDGRKVYLGDIHIEYVEDQPRVSVMEVMSRDKAQSIFGEWERWKNVPYIIDTTDGQAFMDEGSTYTSWNLVALNDEDKVAVLYIYDQVNNRFMILCNGVMMLPINYPLSAISGTGEIPMAQGKLEPISGFAYSKSQPSKTKIDQAVLDEAAKLIVEGFRQRRKPPMGNEGSTVYGSSIFRAGKITSDMKKNKLFSILPDGSLGLNQAEFSFYELFKRSIDEKSLNPNFTGDVVDKQQTATEVDALKNQQLLTLGSSTDAVTNLERRMVWNRIHTILKKWTLPVDFKMDETRQEMVSHFRKFSLKTTVEDGAPGLKMFRFTDEFPPVEDQEQEEEDLTKKFRQPVRLVYMSPTQMRQIRYTFFVMINPSPKNSDQLSQILFAQNIRTAIELFGFDSINQEYAKQRFAVHINEDYNKFFKKADILTMINQGLGQQQGGQPQAGAQGAQRTVGAQGGGQPKIRAAIE